MWPSFFHLFFLYARPYNQKLGSSLIYFFYLYTTIRPKLEGHSYSQIYSFLNCANILFAVLPLCFSATIIPLYFVHYIHRSAALIFRILYPWLYEVLAQLFAGLTFHTLVGIHLHIFKVLHGYFSLGKTSGLTRRAALAARFFSRWCYVRSGVDVSARRIGTAMNRF